MAARKPTADDTSALARFWIGELGTSKQAQTSYLERCRKIRRKYRSEREVNDESRQYAMLWSNTETLLPTVYARPPEPVVGRRFKDADPVGRIASEVLERALAYSVDAQDLDFVLRSSALDYLLAGRAVPWERYVPTFGEEVAAKVEVLQVTTDAGACYEDKDGKRYEAAEEGDDGKFYAETGEAPYRPLVFEESITDYVNVEDFGHTPARTWNEVWYVWRRAFMDRRQLVERFGKTLGNAIPLDYPKNRDVKDGDEGRKAAVFEIWDKRERCAIWISESYGEAVLDKRADPLRLSGFFPCPRPLLTTTANETLIPTPEYALYQDQADEIDTLTAKIGSLQEALKVVGFYAGEGKDDLAQAMQAPNATLIAVKEWRNLQDDGGVRGRIEWWPLDQVVQALKASIELRQQLIEDVRQITGIADIMRGASNPNETYGAQALKAQWGSVRIRDRQKEMARYARDIIRIKGEVIAEHFAPETLAAMTGVQLPTAAEKQMLQVQAMQMQRMGQPVPPQMQEALAGPSWDDVTALLRDDAKRLFRVDIETDSTVEPNEQEEKAQTVELIQAVSGMVAQAGPVIQVAPQLAPMFAAFIKFGARRFRAGRELETIIEQTMDGLVAGGAPAPQGEAAPPPEPPDKTPLEVANVNLERERVKQAGETQRATIEAQLQAGELRLRAADQQIKVATIPRDPNPQVSA